MSFSKISHTQNINSFQELLSDKDHVFAKDTGLSGGRYISITTPSKQTYSVSIKALSNIALAHGKNKVLTEEQRETLDLIRKDIKRLDREADAKYQESTDPDQVNFIFRIIIKAFTKAKQFCGNVLPTLWGKRFKKLDIFNELKQITKRLKNDPQPDEPVPAGQDSTAKPDTQPDFTTPDRQLRPLPPVPVTQPTPVQPIPSQPILPQPAQRLPSDDITPVAARVNDLAHRTDEDEEEDDFGFNRLDPSASAEVADQQPKPATIFEQVGQAIINNLPSMPFVIPGQPASDTPLAENAAAPQAEQPSLLAQAGQAIGNMLPASPFAQESDPRNDLPLTESAGFIDLTTSGAIEDGQSNENILDGDPTKPINVEGPAPKVEETKAEKPKKPESKFARVTAFVGTYLQPSASPTVQFDNQNPAKPINSADKVTTETKLPQAKGKSWWERAKENVTSFRNPKPAVGTKASAKKQPPVQMDNVPTDNSLKDVPLTRRIRFPLREKPVVIAPKREVEENSTTKITSNPAAGVLDQDLIYFNKTLSEDTKPQDIEFGPFQSFEPTPPETTEAKDPAAPVVSDEPAKESSPTEVNDELVKEDTVQIEKPASSPAENPAVIDVQKQELEEIRNLRETVKADIDFCFKYVANGENSIIDIINLFSKQELDTLHTNAIILNHRYIELRSKAKQDAKLTYSGSNDDQMFINKMATKEFNVEHITLDSGEFVYREPIAPKPVSIDFKHGALNEKFMRCFDPEERPVEYFELKEGEIELFTNNLNMLDIAILEFSVNGSAAKIDLNDQNKQAIKDLLLTPNLNTNELVFNRKNKTILNFNGVRTKVMPELVKEIEDLSTALLPSLIDVNDAFNAQNVIKALRLNLWQQASTLKENRDCYVNYRNIRDHLKDLQADLQNETDAGRAVIVNNKITAENLKEFLGKLRKRNLDSEGNLSDVQVIRGFLNITILS